MDIKKMAEDLRMKNEQEFFFKDGMPTLSRSIIAFIDILGFKELINSKDPDKNLNKIYSSFLKCFNETTAFSIATIKTFSDNILFVFPEVEEGNLGSIFITLSALQRELLLEGFVIRGAITVGEIHVGDNIIFGKGLVDAYNLESKSAIMPRIILSSEAMILCQEYLKCYAREFDDPYAKSLLQDVDGFWFLNYLDNPSDDYEFYTDCEEGYLLSHKLFIEKRLEKYSSDIRVFEKYVWLANYHNSFCDINKVDTKIEMDKMMRKITTIK